ncbi:hypothetical protein [Leptospira borgpetersenii]|uniref:hypothetical protein n=1 Tax=Leptospira borgpetersenii TaxID=174 RepID=UPI000774E484|nr:hypothetical protein [Leptospira borgpetersenii]
MNSQIEYSEIASYEKKIEELCIEYIEQSCNEFGRLALSKQIAGKKFVEHHGSGEAYLDTMLSRFHRAKVLQKPRADILLEICARISRLKKS